MKTLKKKKIRLQIHLIMKEIQEILDLPNLKASGFLHLKIAIIRVQCAIIDNNNNSILEKLTEANLSVVNIF